MLRVFILVFLLSGFSTGTVVAGPYTNELGNCLVVSTDETDKKRLVTWIFRVLAEHPDLKKDLGEVFSSKQKIVIDVQVADLFTDLLTKRCRREASQAMKYEPDIALGSSFKLLGEVAADSLMSHPAVNESINSFLQYLDMDKLDFLDE